MKRLVYTTAAVAVFLLLLAPHLLLPPLYLLAGWAFSLRRLGAHWRFAPAAAAAFVTTGLALVVASHFLVASLCRQRRPALGSWSGVAPCWRWRWTWCGFGFGFCALLAGLSAVLATHQVYWMAKSSEPWFINRTHRRLLLLRASHDLRSAAESNQWRTAETQAAFAGLWDFGNNAPVLELLQPVWREGEKGVLQAIVLAPRQDARGGFDRFAVLRPGTNNVIRLLPDLPETLVSLGIAALPIPGAGQTAVIP